MPTIQKRGDTYRITVSAGYDAKGRQIRKSTTWKPAPGMTPKQAQKELDRQAVLFEEKVKSGRCLDGNIRFQDFAERWFEDYAKEHLRIRTYGEYVRMKERTYQAIGHIRLDKLQPHHLLEFYKQLGEPGVNQRTGGGLAPKTILHYHTFISSILDRAVKWGMLEDNPCRRVDPPKAARHEIDCMNDEEALQFLDCLERESPENKALYTLLLYTGMRRGEALGLEWEDVDFQTGVISIKRTSQYTGALGTFTDETKTEQSKRSLRVPMNVIDVLNAHRVAQNELRLKLGDRWQGSRRIFTNADGSDMSANIPLHRLKSILKKNGLREVSLHSLRHTNATLLIQQGISIRAVSGRLGHSQTSTTMNIYAHQIQSADAAAADALDIALSRGRKQA
jgi:integrase family protein